MPSSALLLILYVVFASVVLLVYALTPRKKRYIVLLIFSLLSFLIYSKFLTAFVIASVITVFFAGKLIKKINTARADKIESLQDADKETKKQIKKIYNRKKKLVVTFTLLINLGFLAVLKYSGFFASIFEGIFSWFNVAVELPILQIGMPIGISYYTLTAIGYLIDVSRGKYLPENNIFKLGVFICFFPQAYEGPIARYDEMMPQYELGGGENFNKRNIVKGIMLFLWGLFKKFVIADRLAILTSEIFNNFSLYSGWFVVLGILAFTFQLYIEFSGYINMASGISQMFGIKLAPNFKQPFFSETVSEFWRRWHISLGAWCKDYIFYPVSMSKGMTKLNKKLRGKANNFFQVLIPTSIAMLAVWLTMGIWHGASWLYVVYGLYYYVLMMIGMFLEPLHNKMYKTFNLNKNNLFFTTLRRARTFILVNIGMLIFKASSLVVATSMFGSIFAETSLIDLFTIIPVKDFVVALIGVVIMIVVDCLYYEKIDILEKAQTFNPIVKYLIILALILITLVFGAYGEGYTFVDPMYGGF